MCKPEVFARRALALFMLPAVSVCGGSGTDVLMPASVVSSSAVVPPGPTDVALTVPFTVLVQSASGDPVSGVSVEWSVVSGTGTLSSMTTTTGGDGRASTTLTPVRAGQIIVTANVEPFPPVEFVAVGQEEWIDPTNDTFETAASNGLVAPDITRVTVWPDDASIFIEIEFASTVVSSQVGGPNAVSGFFDIDSDQSAATGVQAATDAFRTGGFPTGLGVDFGLVMAADANGDFALVDIANESISAVRPTFAGNLLMLQIPLSQLGGDDGFVSVATVVGTLPEATDIAPNNGALGLVLGDPSGVSGAPGCSLSWPPRADAFLRRGGCE